VVTVDTSEFAGAELATVEFALDARRYADMVGRASLSLTGAARAVRVLDVRGASIVGLSGAPGDVAVRSGAGGTQERFDARVRGGRLAGLAGEARLWLDAFARGVRVADMTGMTQVRFTGLGVAASGDMDAHALWQLVAAASMNAVRARRAQGWLGFDAAGAGDVRVFAGVSPGAALAFGATAYLAVDALTDMVARAQLGFGADGVADARRYTDAVARSQIVFAGAAYVARVAGFDAYGQVRFDTAAYHGAHVYGHLPPAVGRFIVPPEQGAFVVRAQL